MALKFWQYPKCSTCRKAKKWLDENGVDYQSIDIVEAPPSAAVLKKVMRAADLPARKLFNTSGQVYRQGGYKEKLATMDDNAAIGELAAQGKLIKRPILFGDGVALVGFREAEYAEALK